MSEKPIHDSSVDKALRITRRRHQNLGGKKVRLVASKIRYIWNNVVVFLSAGLSWNELVVKEAPSPRAGHSALCLPYNSENQEEDEVLVFGGGDNDGQFFSDLLSFAVPFQPAFRLK